MRYEHVSIAQQNHRREVSRADTTEQYVVNVSLTFVCLIVQVAPILRSVAQRELHRA